MLKEEVLIKGQYGGLSEEIAADPRLSLVDKMIHWSLINAQRKKPYASDHGPAAIAQSIGHDLRHTRDSLDFLIMIGRLKKHRDGKKVGYEIMRTNDNEVDELEFDRVRDRMRHLSRKKVKQRVEKWLRQFTRTQWPRTPIRMAPDPCQMAPDPSQNGPRPLSEGPAPQEGPDATHSNVQRPTTPQEGRRAVKTEEKKDELADRTAYTPRLRASAQGGYRDAINAARERIKKV